MHWPLTYGAAVDISTGHVTCATFEYHGPDPDIRYVQKFNKEATYFLMYPKEIK